jgi:hypothetical protein
VKHDVSEVVDNKAQAASAGNDGPAEDNNNKISQAEESQNGLVCTGLDSGPNEGSMVTTCANPPKDKRSVDVNDAIRISIKTTDVNLAKEKKYGDVDDAIQIRVEGCCPERRWLMTGYGPRCWLESA